MKPLKTLLTSLLIAHASLLMAQTTKYVGGDISLLTKYEQNGAKYLDYSDKAITATTGNNSPMLTFFANEGLNAMRVRLFVDPTKATTAEKGEGVCQDLDYVKALGKRIKDAGFALMLDLHYSDSWADPGKQWTPEAWQSLSAEQLNDKVYAYTREVLSAMKEAGATPDFIQTGNEISYGMMWGARGTTANRYYAGRKDAAASRFFAFLKRASEACRAECPNAKTILHIERSGNATYATNFYKDMLDEGIDYDIIGLSYYPYYHGDINALETTIKSLESAYPTKQIMIVETGYYHAWQPSDISFDYSKTYPINEDGQKAFTSALIAMLNQHSNVNGLFWWFMEANEAGLDWNTKRVTDGWYNASLFDNSNGKALKALSTLKDFLGDNTHVENITSASSRSIYDLGGRKVKDMQKNKVYVVNGRKVIEK